MFECFINDQITCLFCNKNKTQKHGYITIKLEIDDNKTNSINDAIINTYSKEHHIDFRCENWEKNDNQIAQVNVGGTQKHIIYGATNFVIFHLKRFKFDI